MLAGFSYAQQARRAHLASLKLPKKTQDRIVAGLKRYQPIVRKLAERDISEADTITVIKDMLTDIFGYDKYAELTSEHQVRGTFCDLAIQVDGKVRYLAEVKSAGTSLNNNHLRQVVNYGAHKGIEWVLLTNGIVWKVYRITFAQPIDYHEVYCFDMGAVSARSTDDLAKLFMLSRESITTDALHEFHRQAQILNRFVIAELVLSEPVVSTVRREIRRLFDGLKVTDEEVKVLLAEQVIKRDLLDGEGHKAAKASVKRANNAATRKQAAKSPSPQKAGGLVAPGLA
jgi:hypothetical protein